MPNIYVARSLLLLPLPLVLLAEARSNLLSGRIMHRDITVHMIQLIRF